MAVSAYWQSQDQSIAVLATSLTRYSPCAANGPVMYRTTESQAQVRVQTAGTFSGLCVKILAGNRPGGSVTLRVNGADTALTVSFSGTGTFTNDVDTVAVSVGDLVDYEIFSGTGGAANYAFPSIGVVFTAAKAVTLTMAGNDLGVAFSTASATAMVGIGGEMAVATAANEALVTVKLHGSGTLRNFSMMILTNGRIGPNTATVRKNGANTALTFQVFGSATGLHQDVTHSVTFADGDTLTIGFALITGTGTISVLWVGLEIESNDDLFWAIAGINNGLVQSQAVTRSYALAGTLIAQATEANAQFQHRAIGASATRIGARLSTNTLSGACALALRENGSDSAQVIAIGTGAGTGWIEDVTPDAAVAIADGDLFNHRAVAAAGSGSVTIILLVTEFTAVVIGGTTFFKTVTGSLSLGGTVGRQLALPRTRTGTLSFTSVLGRQKAFKRTQAGTLSFTSTVGRVKSFKRSITGVLRFTSLLTRRAGKRVTGSLSMAGALRKRTTKGLAGTLRFTSALGRVKAFSKAVAGTLSFASTLGRLKSYKRTLTGQLRLQGAVRRLVGKRITGALSLAGAVRKGIAKGLTGTLRFTSALGRLKAFSKPLAGVLSFAGTLTRVKSAGKLLAGVLQLQGAVSKRTGVRRTGVLAFQGTLSRGAALKRTLTGVLSFTSVLGRVKVTAGFFKTLTGILSFGPSTLTRDYTDNPEPVAGPDPWLVRMRRRWGGK